MFIAYDHLKNGFLHQIGMVPYPITEVDDHKIRLVIGEIVIEMSHEDAAELSKAIPERLEAHRAMRNTPPMELAKKPRKTRKKTA